MKVFANENLFEPIIDYTFTIQIFTTSRNIRMHIGSMSYKKRRVLVCRILSDLAVLIRS